MNNQDKVKVIAPFEWTSENTQQFWNKVRQTSLRHSDFAVTAGPRLSELMASFIPKQGAKVLDFGAGGGALPLALSDKGYDATGYDPSLSDQEVLSYSSKPRMCNQCPSETFDAIIVSEVIEHLLEDELEPCFQKWFEMLPVGGRLIITAPYQENLKTALCLCPSCSTTFHRWQHQRSVSFEWLSSYLSQETGWKRVHSGRYDFAADVAMVTAIKRYDRYRSSMQDKVQAMIDAANKDEPGDIAIKVTEGIEALLLSGALTDKGLDYSEGRGNILVHVVEKTRD